MPQVNATMSDMCGSFEKRLVKAKGRGVEFFDGNIPDPSSTDNTNMGSAFGRENEFIVANKKMIGQLKKDGLGLGPKASIAETSNLNFSKNTGKTKREEENIIHCPVADQYFNN
jgi:hypothetical protein